MKKMFGMRKHRNRDRELDERYEEELLEYDEYGDEEYSDEDDFYEDEDDYSDEDYAEDEEYYEDEESDEVAEDDAEYYGEDDYPEEDNYHDDIRDKDDYPEEDVDDSDYAEDDRYYEDNEDYRDEEGYPEEDDYPEDEDDYPEDDYPEDEDDYPEDEDDYPEDDYRDDDYPDDDEDDYRGGYRDDRRGRRDEGRHGRRDRRDEDSVGAKILAFIVNTSVVERIAAGFALLILIGGIATASFYMNAMKGSKQIESFTEIGTNLQGIETIGESGLIAVADAEKARAIAANLIVENTEEEEEVEEIVADDAEDVTIKMTVTSIKSDLKVKFINSKTGKLVANLPLEIDVVNPDGTQVTYNDHDQDGIIYKKDLTAGEYKVTPKALGAGYENYKLELTSKSVTVKDTVEMKAVDVSNEIKKESQVNAAKEDTAVKAEVESVLQDTVEWVESSKTAVGESSDGNYTYEKIDKNSITDPSSAAMLGIGRFMLLSTAATTEISNDNNEHSEDAGNTASSNPEEEKKEETPSENNEGNNQNEQGEVTKGTIKVGSTSIEVTVGEQPVKITVSEPSSVRFSIDREDIATVSSDGTVTGRSEGSATVTVSADNCDDVKVSVKVNAPKKEDGTINVPSNITVKVGETTKLSISGPSAFTIINENDKKASVSSDGTVKGLEEGETKITIKAADYKDATVVIKVDKGDIVLASKEISIKVSESAKVGITGPTEVEYKTSDANIATVEKDGTIKAVTIGTATITVSAKNYNDAKITVTVVAKDMTKVPMGISKVTLVEGKTFEVSSTEKGLAIKLQSENEGIATVSGNVITAKATGETNIKVSAEKYTDNSIKVTVVSKGTVLKDKEGRTVYVKNADGNYVEATYEDYYSGKELFIRKGATTYKYTGWQTFDGKTYFYKADGNYVTGEQVIGHVKYVFGSDGVLNTSANTRGIDVSKWNGNIDWNAVKNSGVQFVIIRCGYRGSSQGALIEDPKFRSNIKGAMSAGLRVGVYFFTQAVNEVEAVEEASMVINLVNGYSLSMPIYLDVESSGGRGDKINAAQRTANIKAFCGTIANAGYTAGVYANKTWFSQMINVSQLTNYRIWLAQYAASVTYTASRYDMWQCTSKGSVPGITGNVDVNICY